MPFDKIKYRNIVFKIYQKVKLFVDKNPKYLIIKIKLKNITQTIFYF